MNIVLINGSSSELINETLNELVANSLNIINYNYPEVSLMSILEEASFYSFFDEVKTIIVHHADFFNKDLKSESELEEFIKYLNDPNEKTQLILITDQKIDARKKLFSIIKDKYKYIQLTNLTSEQVHFKTEKQFSSRGFVISPAAIDYICNTCFNNYDIIVGEINKIALYKGNEVRITDEEVKNLLFKMLDDNEYNLGNAVVARDSNLAYKLFCDLRLNKKDPGMTIALLARKYYQILQTKRLSLCGENQKMIAKILNVSPGAVWHLLQDGNNYTEAEIKQKIISLAELDYKIKSGQIDRYVGFELFLLNN